MPAHLGVDPPPSGPLRPRIATQHGVGREETRMPRVHVGARLESRTARVSVATVTVVAVASGRAAVAAEANIRGKRGYLNCASSSKTLASSAKT